MCWISFVWKRVVVSTLAGSMYSTMLYCTVIFHSDFLAQQYLMIESRFDKIICCI